MPFFLISRVAGESWSAFCRRRDARLEALGVLSLPDVSLVPAARGSLVVAGEGDGSVALGYFQARA